MLNDNFLVSSGKIILEILGEILYFPLWWYGVGLVRTIKKLWLFWSAREQSLGFSIWVKNIFVPMYGQRDIVSRLISFVMRLVQIIFRGIVLLFWLFIILLLLILWLVIPVFLIIALSFQFIN